MQVQVVTDSSCDLPKELINKYNIQVVPLSIHFNEEEYIDQVEIDNETFYKKLAQGGELPKTSRPNPLAFAEAFRKAGEKGPVICITLSSGLSGTYESAVIAKEMVDCRVEVIDSLNASIGIGLQVIKACRLAEEGLSIEEICEEIIKYRCQMNTLFTVDTLENIVKGGRLSSWEGAIGQVLNIKPILYNLPEGVIGTLEKVRGRKRSLKRIIQLAQETGKDFSQLTMGITHAKAGEDLEQMVQDIREVLKPKELIVSELGPVIGSHTGFGTILIAF
ncbi:MAG: DegV family protein [Clostridia bacterium]|nr:DegV family protein [Clostridia bacterium]